MHRVIAQVPGIPDGVTDLVDTTKVTPADGLWALISVVAGVILGRVGRLLVRRYGRGAGLSANVVDLLGTLVMWVIVALGVVVGLVFLGLAITPLWLLLLLVIAMLVIGGRSLFEAFGAGVLLQARAPFEPGDYVVVAGESGIVAEVNSRVVILDAVDGRRLFIPNTEVLRGTIENLTHRKLRMSILELDVEYGTDLDRAIALAEESAKDVDGILRRPPPAAQVRSFETSSIRIDYRFWHEPGLVDEWDATDAAARAVYAAYRDNGIVFAFPNTTLWWGDEDEPQ